MDAVRSFRALLSCRLATKVILLQRPTAAGVPIVRGIVSRRFLATPSSPEKDEQTYDEYSVPKIGGIPIASNYETGASGYNHPDPGMTGGYINPPPEKRQFRSPYGEYWDKQERKNYGETVNEDEDILGRFSPEVYTWTTPAKGLMQWGLVILSFFGICGTVYAVYPDKPAVPRTFPYDGLREALGGEGAVTATPDQDSDCVVR